MQFQQAVALHQQGRLAEADRIYRDILRRNPNNFDVLHMAGVIAIQTGRADEGVRFLTKAAKINPRFAPLQSNLGNAYLGLAQYDKALASCEKAVALDPTFAEAWNNRGIALNEMGRREEALVSCEKAIALRPNYASALNVRGIVLRELGRYEDSAASFASAISFNPNFPQAHCNRGNLFLRLNRLNEAVASYDAAIRLTADMAEAYDGRGAALLKMGQPREALESCRAAIRLKPDYAGAYNNLGNVFSKLDLLTEARDAYAQAIAIQPNFAEALNNLAYMLRRLGHIDEAIAAHERALVCDPTNAEGNRSLLLTLAYHPALDLEAYFAQHRRFEERFAAPRYREIEPHSNKPDPERRLRIGYLSSDLREHTVARSVLPIVRDHARAGFELYFYAEVPRPDAVTAEFQAIADGWRSTVALSDREVADLIRRDGIDILVCLAGRFDGNRPLVCAYKPAPIQIGFHDIATSGLSAIDYLMSDRAMTPRGGAEQFTERLLCLPHFYLAAMPPDVPPIGTRPEAGSIVFGCLNNPAKISDPVLELWGRVLAAIPNSRLMLRYFNAYSAESLRERIFAALEPHGVARDRLDFPGFAESHSQSLAQYNDIDIALDTFPFSGSTTTFDALIMGVPVVTLPGKTMVSRWSAAILVSLGLKDLIASDERDYIEIAQKLAADAARRNRLRETLRGRVAASSLCDHAGKTRHLERYYRAVWRRWCAAQAKTAS